MSTGLNTCSGIGAFRASATLVFHSRPGHVALAEQFENAPPASSHVRGSIAKWESENGEPITELIEATSCSRHRLERRGTEVDGRRAPGGRADPGRLEELLAGADQFLGAGPDPLRVAGDHHAAASEADEPSPRPTGMSDRMVIAHRS